MPRIKGIYKKPKTQEEIVSIISNSNSDFEPNKKAEYSNSNFVLLGFIIIFSLLLYLEIRVLYVLDTYS